MSARPMPVAESILWTPGDQPMAVAAAMPDPVFIRQPALTALNDHLKAAPDKGLLGFLVGEVCDGPESESRYVVVDFIIRLPQLVPGDRMLPVVTQVWPKLQEQVKKSKVRLLGWYHAHPPLGAALSPADLETHRRFFQEPWQFALVLASEERGPVAGFFRPERNAPEAPPLPFYELLDAGAVTPEGKYRSRAAWKNYRPRRPIAGRPSGATTRTSAALSVGSEPPAVEIHPVVPPSPPVAEPRRAAAPPRPPPPRPPPPLPPAAPAPAPAQPEWPAATEDLGALAARLTPAPPPPPAPPVVPTPASRPAAPPSVPLPAPAAERAPAVAPPAAAAQAAEPPPFETPLGRAKPSSARRVAVFAAVGAVVLGGAAAAFMLLRPTSPERSEATVSSPAPRRRVAVETVRATPSRARAGPETVRVAPAPSRPAAEPVAAPRGNVLTAIETRIDLLGDSLATAIRQYLERAALFDARSLDCARLSAARGAVQERRIAYNTERAIQSGPLTAARAQKDRALLAGVDSVQGHFEQSRCGRQ